MPTLTRHQKPILKLPRSWKLILALLILALLILFRAAFYELEKDEPEKTVQNTNTVQGADISAPSADSASSANAAAIPDALPKTAATSTVGTIIGQLKIIQTPTGFLNVRSTPSSDGQIITQVSPGDIFSFTAEQNGWYNIVLPSGQNGWVSAQFITTDLTTIVTPTKAPTIKRNGDGDGADE